MLKLIITIGICLMSTQSIAAIWTEIPNAGNPIPGLKQFVIDSDSVTVDKDITSVWFKMIYIDGRYTRYYAQYDCKRRLSRSRGTLVSADGLKQTKLANSGVVSPIIPETPNDAVFQAVCKPASGEALIDQGWPAFPK